MTRASIFVLVMLVSGCISASELTPGEGVGEYQEAPPKKYSVIDAEVPLVYYGYIDGVYIGYQVAPQIVALKARESFYKYQKTGNKSDLKRALFLTDYLISNATVRDGFIVWEYPFEWPPYNLDKGWIGSLCQAGILKVLLLAYQETGDQKYLEFGDKNLAAFNTDVAKGGLKIARRGGNETYYWYPEYAKEAPPFVLNGFITGLLWLREYYEATDNKLAMKLYEEGLESLVHYLPDYDAGDWSYYDTLGKRASLHYHRMHVRQMEVLYNLTGERIFIEYYGKWKDGLE